MEEIKATAPADTETRISRCTGRQVLPVRCCSTMKLINLSFNTFISNKGVDK